jgi:hypothetical protein
MPALLPAIISFLSSPQEKTFNTVQRSKTQMNEVFEKISTQVLKKDSLELSEKNADRYDSWFN